MTTSENESYKYEIDLSCGDTVGTNVLPALGAYRVCIHCDGRKKVTGVRAAFSGEELPGKPVDLSADMIETVRWAKESGYLQGSLESIIRMANRSLVELIQRTSGDGVTAVEELRDEAQRALEAIANGDHLK